MKPPGAGEIEESSLKEPLLGANHSVVVNIGAPSINWSQARKPPGLRVAEDGGNETPLVSPSTLKDFKKEGWLTAALATALLYAGFMFAATVLSVYNKNTRILILPWLFIGAATCAILSSGLVFIASLSLHQQRLEHHQTHSHRYRWRKHTHRSRLDRKTRAGSQQATPTSSSELVKPPGDFGQTVYKANSGVPDLANLTPGSAADKPRAGPPTPLIMSRAYPYLQTEPSRTPSTQGTPGRSSPSLQWNLAIGVEPNQDEPVSRLVVLVATASLAVSAVLNLVGFTLAQTSIPGKKTPLLLGGGALLLFLLSLGLIVFAVVRRGCSLDGTYAALWLVVDAPPRTAASRHGTSAWPSPKTPKTPRGSGQRSHPYSSSKGFIASTPRSQRAHRAFPLTPGTATNRTPKTPRTPGTPIEFPAPSPVGGSKATTPRVHNSAEQNPLAHRTTTCRSVERAVARILRGTVKTNLVVSFGGLYLNLPLAIIPGVASMFLVGPQKLIDVDDWPLADGVLLPLLFLVSALDFATFFFFVPRSISAMWLALKHPRIASSHVRSGKGAMLLSSVVLLLPFVEFYFCVASVVIYLSADGESIGFGHLLVTPWECLGVSLAGVLVTVITSMVCIFSLKVRLSQWMEPQRLSSRTAKGIVYSLLLVFVVIMVLTSVF